MMNRISSRSSFLMQCSRPRAFTTAAAGSSVEEFPQFTNVSDLIQYVETHLPSMDVLTLSKFVTVSSFAASRLPDGKEFRNSPAMRNIVSKAVQCYSDQDSGTATDLLRRVSEFVSYRGFNVPMYLKNAGHAFADLMTSNKISLSSSDFATASLSICRLGAKDLQFRNFVESSLPNYLPQMTSHDCRTMLSVLHELDVPFCDLHRSLGESLGQKLDQFTNEDVIGCLNVFALSDNFFFPIVHRCVELLTQHPTLFDVVDLISASESLVLLSKFSRQVYTPILEEIQKRVRSVRSRELGSLLGVLSCCGSSYSQFADDVVGMVSSSPQKGMLSDINTAYAICTFNLQERKSLLQTIINDLSSVQTWNPDVCMKAVEIIESAKYDMDIRVEMPPLLKVAHEQYQSQQSNYGSIKVVQELMEKLPEKYQLSVETGIRVGPFLPSLVDNKNKVILEVATPPGPRSLRRHLYEKLGYSSAFVPRLRRNQDESVKIDRLKFYLGDAMVNLGRITKEELYADRDASRDAFRDARAS